MCLNSVFNSQKTQTKLKSETNFSSIKLYIRKPGNNITGCIKISTYTIATHNTLHKILYLEYKIMSAPLNHSSTLYKNRFAWDPLQKFKHRYFWLLLATTNSFKVFILVTRLGVQLVCLKSNICETGILQRGDQHNTTNIHIHATEPE